MNAKYDDLLHYEEEFHSGDRKQFRKERRRALETDRSKYKKTDQDQIKKNITGPIFQEGAKEGRVLAILSEGIQVSFEGALYRCSMKGSLKQEKTTLKNLVAVGDFVYFEPTECGEGCIVGIKPRTSTLSRADNLHRRKQQLIAVNIDQVIITSSIHFPSLKPSLIDRYIIAAHKGNMTPVIVINKIDLLQQDTEEADLLIECEKAYNKLSIPFIKVSTKTGEGMDQLCKIMKGKSSVFSGQSGVGKSSLINKVTGATLKTGDVVEKTFKGSHTTTSSQLLVLPEGGFCVDTPGIKSFGVWDVEASEIQHYFSEISSYAVKCKFPSCSHHTETGCAVKEAVESGDIPYVRYMSYLTLIEELKQEHRLR